MAEEIAGSIIEAGQLHEGVAEDEPSWCSYASPPSPLHRGLGFVSRRRQPETDGWNSYRKLVSFKRKLMAPHTLSDGVHLPKDTIIGMASGPMALSARYHRSPQIFDGFRFHRLRQEALDNAPNAHQFTTTGLGSLMFGHGRYACPGRFFASLESKIVLVNVLQKWDLRLRQGQIERPKNLLLGDSNITDYMAAIEFRARD